MGTKTYLKLRRSDGALTGQATCFSTIQLQCENRRIFEAMVVVEKLENALKWLAAIHAMHSIVELSI